jgi:hypothetical protein
MKIKTTVTEIKCTANELRQSNNLADGIHNILRGCFNGIASDCEESEDEDPTEGSDEEENADSN